MKKFSDFLSEDSSDKLQSKLEKTMKSIDSHVARGGQIHHARALELVDRYNDLKDKAKETDAWEKHCSKHDLDTSHKGHDFYS